MACLVRGSTVVVFSRQKILDRIKTAAFRCVFSEAAKGALVQRRRDTVFKIKLIKG